MDAKRVIKQKHVTGSPPTQMQPSQANIMPGHPRVRSAQALRDERAYLKAQAAGASVHVLDKLRRKALPSSPCLDCGRRMACVCCDKEELAEQLMEFYAAPPAKFEKAIQADVLADQVTESAGDDKEPTTEELLTSQLRDSQQQEDFLRKRIQKKVAELDSLQVTCEAQIAESKQQRDEFEAEMISQRERADTISDGLAKLQTEYEAFQRETAEKLKIKQAELDFTLRNKRRQQSLLTDFFGTYAAKSTQSSILVNWHWAARQSRVASAEAAKLAAKELEMQTHKVQYEKHMEDNRALHTAQVEALESTIAERDTTITRLTTELSTYRAEFHSSQQDLKAEVELLKQRNINWERKYGKLQAALDEEKDQREQDREAARIEREALQKLEEEQTQKNRRVALKAENDATLLPDISEGSSAFEGKFDSLPAELREEISDNLLKAPLARIKELETRLDQAEQEYNIVAAFLDKCQQKVIYLRRRLHAEVQFHLDSQAKYHKLNKDRENLELKMLAQRRCMARRKVTNPEVECRTLGVKNEKLVRHIDQLRDRLGAVKKIANSSSEKNIRWAIRRAAGNDDVKARRAALFESLNDIPVMHS